MHRPLAWSPASSGCGLHGKLLGKPQGCKQEEPNVFQPPLHMFSKHCFGDKLKYLCCSTCLSNILCEYETGDWNCTTKVCSVIWGSCVGFPSSKAAFTSQICLSCFIFKRSHFQRTSHLTNMLEALPTWIPLIETSATVSSPSQSSSIFDASSCEVESWNWPV